MSNGPVLSIRYEQSLDLTSADGWNPGRRVFVQLFDSMISSGLLARLSGNAFKVLSALGLTASPLGNGTARDETFFRDLVSAGVLEPDDRGKLFCCVPHDVLVRRPGVSKNTLSRCTAEPEERGMIAKREIRKRDGMRYNVYVILPGSYLDKYNTHDPPVQRTEPKPVPELGRGSEMMPLPDRWAGLAADGSARGTPCLWAPGAVDACSQVHQQRIARFDQHSSRKGRALRQACRNFSLAGPAAAATEAFNAAVAFAGDPVGWFVIHGPKGNGKSDLAAAIADFLIEERNLPTLFLTSPELLRSLRMEVQASMHGQAEDAPARLDAA
jgi:hypothetical protein